MKFKTATILDILQHHQSNLDKKSSSTFFSCIKIECIDNIVKIISSNGQVFLQHKIEYVSEKNFEIIINGSILYELLKKSSCEYFEFLIDNNQYLIKIDQAIFEFAIKQEESYQLWCYENEEKQTSFKINTKTFNQALKNIKWASSSEDSRPILNSILLHIKDDKLTLCATDTLRLAVIDDVEIKDLSTQSDELKVIIHKKSIFDLIKLLDSYEEDVEIYFNKFMHIIFEKNNIIWKSLIISGVYPNYEKLLNLHSVNTLEIEVQKLSSILERLLIICNQIQPSIFFNFNQNQIEVYCKNSLTNGKDIIYGNYNGSDVTIVLNAKLLLELLNNLKDKIIIKIKDPFSPLVFKEVNNSQKTFIIAPVKNNQ